MNNINFDVAIPSGNWSQISGDASLNDSLKVPSDQEAAAQPAPQADAAGGTSQSTIDAFGGKPELFSPGSPMVNTGNPLFNQMLQETASQGGGSEQKVDGKSVTDILKGLKDTLGEKGLAALIQGGAGMLSGYSSGKMLEAKWANDKKRRDEEWARKDAHSNPGSVATMTWTPNKTGLLGSK